jgi:arginyl-tRNA synthetase
MNLLIKLKLHIVTLIKQVFAVSDEQLAGVDLKLNVDKERSFGDLSCNAAMVLAKQLGKQPRTLAAELQQALLSPSFIIPDLIHPSSGSGIIKAVDIAGPGFINISLTTQAWQIIAQDLFLKKEYNFKLGTDSRRLRYQIEFVSANPTGPLHLGHGRGGIIGDSLARVIAFLGHEVTKEFYINDAGNQVELLGQSFKVRCMQAFGRHEELPEGGYAGQYLVDLAREAAAEFGDDLLDKDDEFFMHYAKEHMLQLIKHDLHAYGITFDEWFSEKTLHNSGAVDQALVLLKKVDLLYEQEGAAWFKSTAFGDDKDRVVKKSNGELTYIAGDIAYHKNKFDRGYDKMINVLGQDHHGYVKRLKATMQALGYDSSKLDVILYQLVSLKENDELVRMSKRAGTFTKLSDVIDAVGTDVARFFFLNRKADAHLEFDLAVALKKTEENPVYYIHYAFVRTKSLLTKAKEFEQFKAFLAALTDREAAIIQQVISNIGEPEIALLKKIMSLCDVLLNIAQTYQTHILSYYTWELAHAFHNFYTNNRVIDPADEQTTKMRLFMVSLVKDTLEICLDLLGLSKPERM